MSAKCHFARRGEPFCRPNAPSRGRGAPFCRPNALSRAARPHFADQTPFRDSAEPHFADQTPSRKPRGPILPTKRPLASRRAPFCRPNAPSRPRQRPHAGSFFISRDHQHRIVLLVKTRRYLLQWAAELAIVQGLDQVRGFHTRDKRDGIIIKER